MKIWNASIRGWQRLYVRHWWLREYFGLRATALEGCVRAGHRQNQQVPRAGGCLPTPPHNSHLQTWRCRDYSSNMRAFELKRFSPQSKERSCHKYLATSDKVNNTNEAATVRRDERILSYFTLIIWHCFKACILNSLIQTIDQMTCFLCPQEAKTLVNATDRV